MTKKPSEYHRRRLIPFFVLVLLLYGSHGSVTWTAPLTCRIDSTKFAKSIRITTFDLRRAVEYLSRTRYITDYDWGPGWVTLTLRAPVDRSVEEAS